MFGVRPPSVDADKAPTWMVGDATAYTHTEHKRDAAVKAVGHGKAVTTAHRALEAQGATDTAPTSGGRGRGR